MPGYVIGLDLGRRCVKAAVLKGSFRGFEVEDFLSLEPEQPEDGSAPSDEAVYAAARAILDRKQSSSSCIMPSARGSSSDQTMEHRSGVESAIGKNASGPLERKTCQARFS